MYRALYRKWRPLRFEDVVGQKPIVTALKNQIEAQHIGHAYLFTGVRGTGKTSCAKIFAKAVNCTNPHAGDPCGACEICRGIDNGSLLDVVEMDAASNNGVDNIRDLRDETAYTPSTCRYKVYIIDEVHMLSSSAFNALLKTLEEPPSHVIFILATTEIQKVPATILSRCQRYDFTRIQPDDLAGQALRVAQSEGLSLTEGAANLIARLADGALRDTLSILDTCAGVTNEIDEEVVRRMAGVTDKAYLFQISDALQRGDGVCALAELAELRQKSVDLKRLAEELIQHYRNFMLVALPNGNTLLSNVSPDEEAQYIAQSQSITQGHSIRAIRVLGNALEKMTRGSDQRIALELALFTLSEPPVQMAQRAQFAQGQGQPQPMQAQPMQGQGRAQPFVAAAPQAQAFASAPVGFTQAPVAVTSTTAVGSAPAPAPVIAPTSAQASPVVTTSQVTAPVQTAPPSQAVPVETVPPLSMREPPPEPEELSSALVLGDEAPPWDAQPLAPKPVLAPVETATAQATKAVTPVAQPQTNVQTEHGAMVETSVPVQNVSASGSAHGDNEQAPYAPVQASAPTAAQAPTQESVSETVQAPTQESVSETVQAPATASAQTAVQTTVPAEKTLVPFAQWGDVIQILFQKDPMLHGYLFRSQAYYNGTHVLIDGGKVFRDFIRSNKASQALIKKLIHQTSGITCGIGPYVAPVRQETRASAEETLKHLAEKGLDISIQDTL